MFNRVPRTSVSRIGLGIGMESGRASSQRLRMAMNDNGPISLPLVKVSKNLRDECQSTLNSQRGLKRMRSKALFNDSHETRLLWTDEDSFASLSTVRINRTFVPCWTIGVRIFINAARLCRSRDSTSVRASNSSSIVLSVSIEWEIVFVVIDWDWSIFVVQIIATVIEKIHQESERLEKQLSLAFHQISSLVLFGLKRKRFPSMLDPVLVFNVHTDRRLTVTCSHSYSTVDTGIDASCELIEKAWTWLNWGELPVGIKDFVHLKLDLIEENRSNTTDRIDHREDLQSLVKSTSPISRFDRQNLSNNDQSIASWENEDPSWPWECHVCPFVKYIFDFVFTRMSKKWKRRIWRWIDIVNRKKVSHGWIDIRSDQQRSGEHAAHRRSHSSRIELDEEITSAFLHSSDEPFKSMISKVHDGTISAVSYEKKFSIFIAQSLDTNRVTVIDDLKFSGKNKGEFSSPEELDSGATSTVISAPHPHPQDRLSVFLFSKDCLSFFSDRSRWKSVLVQCSAEWIASSCFSSIVLQWSDDWIDLIICDDHCSVKWNSSLHRSSKFVPMNVISLFIDRSFLAALQQVFEHSSFCSFTILPQKTNSVNKREDEEEHSSSSCSIELATLLFEGRFVEHGNASIDIVRSFIDVPESSRFLRSTRKMMFVFIAIEKRRRTFP